jgi:hypothetical protein
MYSPHSSVTFPLVATQYPSPTGAGSSPLPRQPSGDSKLVHERRQEFRVEIDRLA